MCKPERQRDISKERIVVVSILVGRDFSPGRQRVQHRDLREVSPGVTAIFIPLFALACPV